MWKRSYTCTCTVLCKSNANIFRQNSRLFLALTKKYRIFDESEFSTKSHNNLWCLLFPTTWIFERQFARNENWLWIYEWKFTLFDKWLRTFERNFALYLLCSNIPTHFLGDNLPSLNLPGWFFFDVTSHCKLYNKLVSLFTTGLYKTHLYYLSLRLPKQRAKQTTYTQASFSKCFRYSFVANA